MLFGNKIKELRDKHEVLQRQLAAYLEIDTPMFSKIERGDRRAKMRRIIFYADVVKDVVKGTGDVVKEKANGGCSEGGLIKECKMKIKSIVSCGFSLKNMYFCTQQYNKV